MNRSIIILPAFLLVALLLTVVYALLGFRGPEPESPCKLDEPFPSRITVTTPSCSGIPTWEVEEATVTMTPTRTQTVTTG